MVRNYKRKTIDLWSTNDLLKALFEIKNGIRDIKEASKKYGISRATLYRQYAIFKLNDFNPVVILEKRGSGGNAVLTRDEEKSLEQTIGQLVKTGHAVTEICVRRICYEYCRVNLVPNNFKPDKAGLDWYYGFVKRNPNVAELIKQSQTQNASKKKDVTEKESVPLEPHSEEQKDEAKGQENTTM